MSASRPRLRDRGFVRSAIAKLIKFRESSPIGQKNQKIYCLASTSPFGRVKYIILLVLHAAVGEAAFILIILASSGERAVAATASA